MRLVAAKKIKQQRTLRHIYSMCIQCVQEREREKEREQRERTQREREREREKEREKRSTHLRSCALTAPLRVRLHRCVALRCVGVASNHSTHSRAAIKYGRTVSGSTALFTAVSGLSEARSKRAEMREPSRIMISQCVRGNGSVRKIVPSAKVTWREKEGCECEKGRGESGEGGE